MAQEKILIVDDEVVVAEDIRRQLHSLGYTVVGVVSSGNDAVYVAGEHRPDVILMDVKLKGPIDGIDAARMIHTQYGIPVIYLTAFSDEDTLERARRTLPLAYLIKPFVSSDLRAALELALFRHRVSRIAEQRGRWLDAVVQSMGDAVVTVDPLGRVTLLNPAAEQLTGWSQSDALGKAIQDVMVLLDPKQRTFNLCHLDPTLNVALGAMQAAGAAFDWFGRLLAAVGQSEPDYQALDDAAAPVPAGSRGLLFLPYLLGERSPHWNPLARGAFVGLSMAHGRAEMARAVMEGVAFNLRHILDILRGQGAEATAMRLIGGGGKSALWRRILAGVYGLPVEQIGLSAQATSLGAAIAGGVGVGLFPAYTIARSLAPVAALQPPDLQASYQAIYPLFEQTYLALEPIFGRLAELTP